MKKKLLILCVVLFCSVASFAQSSMAVTGIVTEKRTGDPMIGVTVQVKGQSGGTVTGFDGSYRLSGVPADGTLVFSFMGMQSAELPIDGKTKIDAVMAEDHMQLDEVVVVGYGTARKRDLTGSIVSIKGDDLKNAPGNNPIKALQGKVPGLSVTNTGSAGGSPTIRLRGVATVNASTNPLFVVDGMFVDNIDFVNPNDITSLEVLKDPSSLAIFGVQGANGVIIITTRRADSGKLNVSYDGYAGVQMLHSRDKLNLTNASEFTMLYNEQLKNENPNAKEWTPDLLGKGTDWQDEILRPAVITNHGVSVSKSSDKGSSLLSLGYFMQDGIVKYDSYQRINARLASDYNVSKHVKVGANVNLSRWSSDPTSASVAGAAHALPTYSPYAPQEDWNNENIGSHFTPSPSIQKDIANPVAVMEINKGNSESYGYRLVGNAYTEINFLKDFILKITGYADLGTSYSSKYSPKFDVNNANSNSSHKSEKTSFKRSTDEYTKYQADFLLNYNKKVGSHSFGGMLGYTARVQGGKGFNASSDSLVDPSMSNVPKDFWMLGLGSDKTMRAGDWFSEEAFISYLARFNYAYASKYLLTATFRSDGSSKFSPNNRWGYFPSLGLGWVISEEAFMEKTREHVDFLKIKASFGQLGNDKIGNYLWFPTINPKGQQVVIDGKVYYIPTVSNLVDKNIHWEIVSGFDGGIEGQFFGSRLSAELGYYTKTTKDLLAYVAPPASVGAGFAITNAGSIRNSGFEFLLSWNDRLGDFTYGLSVNGSTLKNEVLSLGHDDSDIITGSYHRTSVGHPIGSMFGYVQEGIFQTQAEIDAFYPTPWKLRPGDIRYKDVNGDGRINEKDRTFIGSSLPNFYYGFGLNAGYKGFDFNIDFEGVSGNKIVNTKKLPTFTQFNYYDFHMDRWQGEGTSNREPILDQSRGHNYLPSTNLLESGSYIRIRSIQLGYTLPQTVVKSMGMSKLRLFANAQNPITFKKNSGYTPEIGGSILGGGVDGGSTYPLPSVYSFGLTVNF